MKIIKAKRKLVVPIDPQASLEPYIRTKLVAGGEFVIVSDETISQLDDSMFEVHQSGKKRGRKPKEKNQDVGS